MKVMIQLEELESQCRVEIHSDDEHGNYVWIKLINDKNQILGKVLIEELRLAIRKMTAK